MEFCALKRSHGNRLARELLYPESISDKPDSGDGNLRQKSPMNCSELPGRLSYLMTLFRTPSGLRFSVRTCTFLQSQEFINLHVGSPRVPVTLETTFRNPSSEQVRHLRRSSETWIFSQFPDESEPLFRRIFQARQHKKRSRESSRAKT